MQCHQAYQAKIGETANVMMFSARNADVKGQCTRNFLQCLAIRSHALGMQHPETAAGLHALSSKPSRVSDEEMFPTQAWLRVKHSNSHPILATILVDTALNRTGPHEL